MNTADNIYPHSKIHKNTRINPSNIDVVHVDNLTPYPYQESVFTYYC